MRLSELDPRWLLLDGRKVGVIFRCPHCGETWLSCFFEPTPVLNGGRPPNQFSLFEAALGDDEAARDVVPCRKDFAWKRTTDDFETMSITPSIDASASRHWHGFVTEGACL